MSGGVGTLFAETSSVAALSPERRRWLSDQLIRPTQLVFAVVIASSLQLYRQVLVNPFHHGHYVAALALLSVYFTTVWSWVGWHNAIADYPYRIRRHDGSPRTTEIWRFYTDLLIVIVYAYTLFRIEPMIGHPGSNIILFLIGFPMIFIFYFIENLLRVRLYGPKTRRRVPLGVAFGVTVLLTVAYGFTYHALSPAVDSNNDRIWLNGIAIVVFMASMKAYRWFNTWYRQRLLVRAG